MYFERNVFRKIYGPTRNPITGEKKKNVESQKLYTISRYRKCVTCQETLDGKIIKILRRQGPTYSENDLARDPRGGGRTG